MNLATTASSEIICYKWPDCKTLLSSHLKNSASINSISWSKDSSWLLIVQNGVPAEILSFSDVPKLRLTLPSHFGESYASCAAFQHNTKRSIAIGTQDGQVVLYDIKASQIKKRFPRKDIKKTCIKNISFTPSDTHLICYNAESQICVYNVCSSNRTASLVIPKTKTITAMRCHTLKNHLVAGASEEGIIAVWDLNVSKAIANSRVHSSSIMDIAMVPHQEQIVSAGLDGILAVYDYKSRKTCYQIDLPRTSLCVDVSPDGMYIASGFMNGRVHIYDVRNVSRTVMELDGHTSPVKHIRFEPPVSSHNSSQMSDIAVSNLKITPDNVTRISPNYSLETQIETMIVFQNNNENEDNDDKENKRDAVNSQNTHEEKPEASQDSFLNAIGLNNTSEKSVMQVSNERFCVSGNEASTQLLQDHRHSAPKDTTNLLKKVQLDNLLKTSQPVVESSTPTYENKTNLFTPTHFSGLSPITQITDAQIKQVVIHLKEYVLEEIKNSQTIASEQHVKLLGEISDMRKQLNEIKIDTYSVMRQQYLDVMWNLSKLQVENEYSNKSLQNSMKINGGVENLMEENARLFAENTNLKKILQIQSINRS